MADLWQRWRQRAPENEPREWQMECKMTTAAMFGLIFIIQAKWRATN